MGRVRRVFLTLVAFVRFVGEKFRVDIAYIFREWRLFAGMALVVTGLLSFVSDRYCDGNSSSAYTCTRPATYYYYPWWATVLVVVGGVLVVLWFLRKK